MATGGVSVDTPDETFDNVCSVCKEKNKQVEAAKYCVDCCDYYCGDCVKIHTTIPALKGHTLHEKEEGATGTLLNVPTERCDRHNFKLLDMYCQNHNVVGCYTCIAVDHRTCQDVFYIPEFVKTRKKSVPEFLERLEEIETKLQNFLTDFKDDATALDANKCIEIEKVNTFARQLEEKIREAERDAISEIKNRYKDLNVELNDHIHNLKKDIENVETTKSEINSSIQNMSQAFVLMLFREGNALSAEDTAKSVEKFKLGRRLKFVLDKSNESLMTKRQPLGVVKTLPYNFIYKGEFNIKLSSDTKPCDVYGSCFLSDGSIVFADKTNKTLKLIDAVDLKVVDHHVLTSEPWEVCCMNGNEIAVCLPDEKKVQVVKVNRTMSLHQSLEFKFNCRCITCHDEKLYIADQTCLYVCSKEGLVLNTIVKGSGTGTIFNNIYNVLVNTFSNLIMINDCTDQGKGVVTLDGDGQIVNEVTSKITWPHGLTEADNGKVFACGYLSKNIIILNANGEYEKTVITDKKHLTGPQALCFNCRTGRLYVPNCNRDSVQWYELK